MDLMKSIMLAIVLPPSYSCSCAIRISSTPEQWKCILNFLPRPSHHIAPHSLQPLTPAPPPRCLSEPAADGDAPPPPRPRLLPADYVLTGSLDDTVKVWEWTEGQLAHRHTLEGHALGVMSVDIAADGGGELAGRGERGRKGFTWRGSGCDVGISRYEFSTLTADCLSQFG